MIDDDDVLQNLVAIVESSNDLESVMATMSTIAKTAAIATTASISHIESALWPIANSVVIFRRNVCNTAMTIQRYLNYCRTISYRPIVDTAADNNDDREYEYYDRIVDCREDVRGGDGDQIRAAVKSAVSSDAVWSMTRSLPLRLISESIDNVKSESSKLREDYVRMFELGSTERRKNRDVEVEEMNRMCDLAAAVKQLRALLERAPVESQIKIQQYVHAMQLYFEDREKKDAKKWMVLIADVDVEIENLLIEKETLNALGAKIVIMERIDRRIRDSISSKLHEITKLLVELQAANNSLENIENNLVKRTLHLIRVKRHERRGKDGGVSSNEIEHIRTHVYPRVSMRPDEIEPIHVAFCRRQCERLIAVGGKCYTDLVVRAEARANVARDRLVAYMFFYGDAATMSELRAIASVPNVWVTARSLSENAKRLNVSSKTLERLLRYDWTPLTRVCYSVIVALLDAFDIRREHFDRLATTTTT